MYEIDRDIYLAFARALQLDFHFMREIIDGRLQASPELAKILTAQTNTWNRLWTAEGKTKERLMTVRVWYAARKHQPDFTAWEPEPFPPARPGCRHCD